jgi:hypothetical protein
LVLYCFCFLKVLFNSINFFKGGLFNFILMGLINKRGFCEGLSDICSSEGLTDEEIILLGSSIMTTYNPRRHKTIVVIGGDNSSSERLVSYMHDSGLNNIVSVSAEEGKRLAQFKEEGYRINLDEYCQNPHWIKGLR